MPKSNLPAKPIDKILSTPDSDLSKLELALKKELQGEVDRQESDESAYDAQPLKIEVAHQVQLFKMPDGSSNGDIEIIIAGSVKTRGMWGQEDAAGNSPRHCSSLGGKVGQPTEDGPAELRDKPVAVCAGCRFNEFGSGKEGRGKACKEMRKLLTFHPSYKQGLILTVPPSSIRAYDGYYQSCVSSGVPIAGYWTKVVLEEQSRGSVQWSTLNFSRSNPIDAELFGAMKEIRDKFSDGLKKVEDDDYMDKKSSDTPKSKDDDLPF
jgi:hypothetical protein